MLEGLAVIEDISFLCTTFLHFFFSGAQLLSQGHEGRHLRPLESEGLQWASRFQARERRLPPGSRHAFHYDSFSSRWSPVSHRRVHRQPLLHRGRQPRGHPGRRGRRNLGWGYFSRNLVLDPESYTFSGKGDVFGDSFWKDVEVGQVIQIHPNPGFKSIMIMIFSSPKGRR